MSQRLAAVGGATYLNLLAPLTITTAITGVVSAQGVLPAAPAKLTQCKYLVCEAILLVATGGTTIDAYVQTSLDEGVTWVDIMNFHFTTSAAKAIEMCSAYLPLETIAGATVTVVNPYTPTDGSLASNTTVQGVLGDRFRVKVTTTGTYTGGTSLQVVGFAKG